MTQNKGAIMTRYQRFFTHKVNAFSLIELSLVLVIMGVLMGAIFKGQDLLDSAKVQSIVTDCQNIKLAIHGYQEVYNTLPGDDPKASTRWADTTNGNGNGYIDGSENDYLWVHLHKNGDIGSPTAPSSKFGGIYKIVYQPQSDMSGHWIELVNQDGSGVLTPKQAQKLMTKIDGQQGAGDNPTQGYLRAINDASGNCLSGQGLNLQNTSASCIVYMRLS